VGVKQHVIASAAKQSNAKHRFPLWQIRLPRRCAPRNDSIKGGEFKGWHHVGSTCPVVAHRAPVLRSSLLRRMESRKPIGEDRSSPSVSEDAFLHAMVKYCSLDIKQPLGNFRSSNRCATLEPSGAVAAPVSHKAARS
jgi:hypothetical protein